MRWRMLLSTIVAVLAVVAVPNSLEAQELCGRCEHIGVGKFKCVGPVSYPNTREYCFGTAIFGIYCFMCPRGPDEDSSEPEPETPLALDGSFVQNAEYRRVILHDPDAGLLDLQQKRSVVFFPCNGGIAARRYEETLEESLRRRSTVIVI